MAEKVVRLPARQRKPAHRLIGEERVRRLVLAEEVLPAAQLHVVERADQRLALLRLTEADRRQAVPDRSQQDVRMDEMDRHVALDVVEGDVLLDRPVLLRVLQVVQRAGRLHEHVLDGASHAVPAS